MNSFWFGVLASLTATVIWNILIRKVSLPNIYPYPDIRGKWKGEYEVDGNTIIETINVKQQFWRWFSGTFTWTNPENSKEMLDYKFSGKFVFTNSFRGYFKVKSRRRLDHGTFVFSVDHDTKKGVGGIVGIDFKTNKPRVNAYRITRLMDVYV